MIYITGDLHGDLKEFISRVKPNGSEWTADDKLIVGGDFGFVFDIADENGEYKDDAKLDYIAEYLPQQILFVSGNHENFDRLYAYPDVPLYGGTAKEIRNGKIYLLKRGECYSIEEKSFFAFGGAYSVDRHLRKEGVSWWQQELPSSVEYRRAIETIKKYRRFDYVITHTCPERIIYLMKKRPDFHEAELTGFLDWLFTEVDFKAWYFGHWHIDEEFYDGRITACFKGVYAIPDISNDEHINY